MASSDLFLIQHSSSKKYIHPYNSSTEDGAYLVIKEVPSTTGSRITDMQFRFISEENGWGYLQHVISQKYIHPENDPLQPYPGSYLVINSNKNAACLFAIDQRNDWIVHKGGLPVHAQYDSPDPYAGTYIVLDQSKNDAMKWKLVDQVRSTTEVSIYGKAEAWGEWKILNAILNPEAEHVTQFEYKLGKSKTRSSTTEIAFGFELGMETGFNIGFVEANVSMKASFSSRFEQASSNTWSEETTKTRIITGINVKSFPHNSIRHSIQSS